MVRLAGHGECLVNAKELPEEPPVAASDKAIEVGELSVGLYYLLLEHRNRAALDPDAVLREHASCAEVQASLLDELVDCLPLACPIAYASNAAEAQRQLRLVSGSWELVLLEPQGPGGQPQFLVAADRHANRVAVLIPGTQTPSDSWLPFMELCCDEGPTSQNIRKPNLLDCVTDLKALPVRVRADGRTIGWVHCGMMRQACAVVRVVGSILERFEKQGFQVLFIGHSLGAGVSAIAGAVCRLGIEGPKLTKVRSLCYATPAVGNGSFGKFCEGHATTVINCEDVVPRLSLETARKLRDELLSRKEAYRRFVMEDIDALKDLNNLTEKKTPATLQSGMSASLLLRQSRQTLLLMLTFTLFGLPPVFPAIGTAPKRGRIGTFVYDNKHRRIRGKTNIDAENYITGAQLLEGTNPDNGETQDAFTPEVAPQNAASSSTIPPSPSGDAMDIAEDAADEAEAKNMFD
eukprot:s3807_g2.t1